MIERPKDEIFMPIPDYEPRSTDLTVCIHFGGKLVKDKYVGGNIAKWDYVELNDFCSISLLEAFADLCSVGGVRKFYRYTRGYGFVQLEDDAAVYDLSCDNVETREASVWIESVGQTGEEMVYEAEKNTVDKGKGKGKMVEETVKKRNIDARVRGVSIVEFVEESSDSESDCVGASSDEFDSSLDSDDEEDGVRNANRQRRPVYHNVQNGDPRFELEMTFATKDDFRRAVQSHAVAVLRSVKIVKNDKYRMWAQCKEPGGCKWRVHCHRVNEGPGFQVHTYFPEHLCVANTSCKFPKTDWLANRFLSSFKIDPAKTPKVFILEVQKETGLLINESVAYRVRKRALSILEGDPDAQYGMLWDYSEELRAKNPGSTVVCDVDRSTNQFRNFYVCFQALKEGFMVGCRPILGCDGCHLKGHHEGVLLTALGVDPNNKPFPIAYAVVSHETGETWTWFLSLLRSDLNIVEPERFTFISDKQKGLIKAVCDVFPGAVHRFCVRHLLKNFWTAGHRGDGLKYALYRASNATTKGHFKEAMSKVKDLSEAAYRWLELRPPEQGKASFAKVSKAKGATISGLRAPDKTQTATLGPVFVKGGKKFVSLKNVATAVQRLNKEKDVVDLKKVKKEKVDEMKLADVLKKIKKEKVDKDNGKKK